MARIRSLLNQLPMRGEPARWFAFRTGFKREKRAASRLRGRGFEVYLPLREVVRHYKSKTTTSQQPIFNNYLFARITGEEYAGVLSDPDVYEIVHFDEEVGIVSDEEIAFLKTVLRSDTDAQDVQLHEGLLAGDPVIISGGTLAGTRGYVLAERANSNFVVELKALGVGVAMTVEARYIARDTSASPGN